MYVKARGMRYKYLKDLKKAKRATGRSDVFNITQKDQTPLFTSKTMFRFASVFFLSLKPWSFVQSLFFLRYACAPIAPISYLITFCVLYFFSFFFGDVSFPEYFCTITVLSLYGEDVVRFPFPDGVFLPCDHGLDV